MISGGEESRGIKTNIPDTYKPLKKSSSPEVREFLEDFFQLKFSPEELNSSDNKKIFQGILDSNFTDRNDTTEMLSRTNSLMKTEHMDTPGFTMLQQLRHRLIDVSQ